MCDCDKDKEEIWWLGGTRQSWIVFICFATFYTCDKLGYVDAFIDLLKGL